MVPFTSVATWINSSFSAAFRDLTVSRMLFHVNHNGPLSKGRVDLVERVLPLHPCRAIVHRKA